MRLTTIVLTLLLTAAAHADGEHDIQTPVGFVGWAPLSEGRVKTGLSVVVRPNGHILVWAPEGSLFDREPGHQGSSLAWRSSDPRLKFSTNCLYSSPEGHSGCNENDYWLADGMPKSLTDEVHRKSFTHTETNDAYITPEMAADGDLLFNGWWTGGTTMTLGRDAQGVRYLKDDHFEVGDGPWLVSQNAPSAVPEPSAALLGLTGLLFCSQRMRRGHHLCSM